MNLNTVGAVTISTVLFAIPKSFMLYLFQISIFLGKSEKESESESYSNEMIEITWIFKHFKNSWGSAIAPIMF